MSGSLSQEEIDAVMDQGAEKKDDDATPEADALDAHEAAEVAATAEATESADATDDDATAEVDGEDPEAPEADGPEPIADEAGAGEDAADEDIAAEASDGGGGSDEGPSADALEISGEVSDALGEVGNICMANAATSLSGLLGHPVGITAPRVATSDEQSLRDEHPQPTTLVTIGFTEGLVGSNALMLSIRDASIIADLMMGGAGEPSEELSEMQASAVSEAMNQMMGSAATSMAELVGRRVDISSPEVEVLDLNNATATLGGELSVGPFIQVAFTMTVGDLIETEIMQLMTPAFADELVASLLEPASADQPEADAPAPEAPAAAASAPTAEAPAASAPLAHPVAFPALEPAEASGSATDIALLLDVPLHVTVELGRTELRIRNVLDLVPGSIIELDKLAGEPVDVLVNGKNIARGEVVVIDEEFGVRITDVATPASRLSGLAQA